MIKQRVDAYGGETKVMGPGNFEAAVRMDSKLRRNHGKPYG